MELVSLKWFYIKASGPTSKRLYSLYLQADICFYVLAFYIKKGDSFWKTLSTPLIRRFQEGYTLSLPLLVLRNIRSRNERRQRA